MNREVSRLVNSQVKANKIEITTEKKNRKVITENINDKTTVGSKFL
jgi:hypothetical protein